ADVMAAGAVRKTLWSDSFLNPDHIQLGEMARDFAKREIHPQAEKIDRDHKFPTEIIKKMGELGFLGMMVPTEWGGAGLDTLAYATVLEEIAVACASTAVVMSVNNSLVCAPLTAYGTDAQKEKYLRPLASGTMLG